MLEQVVIDPPLPSKQVFGDGGGRWEGKTGQGVSECEGRLGLRRDGKSGIISFSCGGPRL